MLPSLEELREVATELAYRAGRLTLGYFGYADVQQKSDRTPVTEADRAAERFMREELARIYPSHGIFGEEFGEHPAGAPIRWVLDPVDGTKAFMRGIPTYAVLVACEIDGLPKVAAAYLPALGEMYSAAEGCGASLNGRTIRVSTCGELERSLLLTGDQKLIYSHGKGAAFEALRDRCYECRALPDAFGHLLVASGRAEIMADPILHRWDLAALIPIVKEAGGRTTDWYGSEEYFRPEAISTNPTLLPSVLRTVAEAAKP